MTSALVDHLLRLQRDEDRGALATLRRGLGKPVGAVSDMFPHVVRYLPEQVDEPLRRRLEDDAFLVASLFGLHPKHDGAAGSLGATMRRLGEHPSAELRFRRLIEAERHELPSLLRRAVNLARGKDLSLDYHRLHADVRHWTLPNRDVQRRWARDYWSADPESHTDHPTREEER